jgi:hypothetical protein
MSEILITDDYRNSILKSPHILAIRFIDGQPVEIISHDPRYERIYEQVVLTRDQVLGNFKERLENEKSKI